MLAFIFAKPFQFAKFTKLKKLIINSRYTVAVFTTNLLMNVALQLFNFYAIQGFKY